MEQVASTASSHSAAIALTKVATQEFDVTLTHLVADFGTSPTDRPPTSIRNGSDRLYASFGLRSMTNVAVAFGNRYPVHTFIEGTAS